MTIAIVALDEPHGTRLARELSAVGVDVRSLPASAPAVSAADADATVWAGAELLLVPARHDTLTRELVATCDLAGVRIVPIGEGEVAARLSFAFGLAGPTSPTASARDILTAARSAPAMPPGVTTSDAAVVAVWGPAGAPGRTTVAIELAGALARMHGHAALVDADTHAPSIALTLGLPDEGPGFAAACRHAHRGALDPAELERIALPLGRRLRVLTGINRPSRWPELREDRVRAALEICREWVPSTVVDVAASLERDEEIVSDVAGDRRNAATIGALLQADVVVAVAAADPVGISRFLRGYAHLRETVGATPIVVVANRLRPGSLGIDARGQVRRTLDRFAGIRDVWFVPQDPRSADAALLAARPIAEISPRSPIVAAIRRLAEEGLARAVSSAA